MMNMNRKLCNLRLPRKLHEAGTKENSTNKQHESVLKLVTAVELTSLKQDFQYLKQKNKNSGNRDFTRPANGKCSFCTLNNLFNVTLLIMWQRR